jgi:hypothetical protein
MHICVQLVKKNKNSMFIFGMRIKENKHLLYSNYKHKIRSSLKQFSNLNERAQNM